MRVQILLSAIGDYMPKYQHLDTKPQQALIDEVIQQAKAVWATRQPQESAVRFLQKMPAQNGSHFRFLEVTQKDENTLLVSGGRTR
ncbi:hypothetical protein ACVND7_06860 [Avibacterium paragallinarum]|uniref:Hemophilus-specific protein n=2 Tax=Pasteurellaceae TaxID=712 RepID=A0ABU7QHG8_AVIPA|nr:MULTISPECIES: hypothetical protein [Pasteurellaceae]KGQ52261.1 hypothetical protein IO46_06640 [Gallibacterium anatis]KGQ62478.1 hypothetical protein IO48_04095 [Gallibacterium anatis 4895]QCA40379.1 hypothetical protein E5138_09550 [Pasteurella multocida]HDX0975798.1 hypothetical protein [Pasteurella multocida]HDX0976644.1 hypothetical protein [Pasteurella multocida]